MNIDIYALTLVAHPCIEQAYKLVRKVQGGEQTLVCVIAPVYDGNPSGPWCIWTSEVPKIMTTPAARRQTFQGALTRGHEMAMTVLQQGWDWDWTESVERRK